MLVSQSRSAEGLLVFGLGLGMLGLGSALTEAVGVTVGRSVELCPSSVDLLSVQPLSRNAARKTAIKVRLNGFRAESFATGELSVSS